MARNGGSRLSPCARAGCRLWSGIHCVVCVCVRYSLSCVQLFATPRTVACQAPLSMGLSRQDYWSGLPFPFPEDLPDPGIEPGSCALQVDSLPSQLSGKPLKVLATQSCLTLCDTMDCSPSGSSVHGILQVRLLEWVAISFSSDYEFEEQL